jgi:hypothetical protein
MAYFAKLNSNSIVEKVISINNAVITDSNGVEQEQLGNDFINKLYNTRRCLETNFIQLLVFHNFGNTF